jgi:predicted RNA-binding protein YlqC (UPF0109 family)
VRKVEVATSNVTAAMIDFVEQHPVDLVVVGTEQRFGIASLLRPGPQRIVGATQTMTLFVPGADTGFVSLAHGGFNLQRVLVPVAAKPDSQPAIIHAFRSAMISSEDIVRMCLLVEGEQFTILKLRVATSDIGKVIGKQGRTARSIRTILGAAAWKLTGASR